MSTKKLKNEILIPTSTRASGAGRAVYVHFPYCLYKCRYCDFNSYATERGEIPVGRYVRSLLAEMDLREAAFGASGRGFFARGEAIASVFFGGGTPSLMPAAAVAEVMDGLTRRFRLDSDAELTLEANPGTVTEPSFKAFRAAGVNRISLGIQSFHDRFLSPFGRIHTGAEAERALAAAFSSGVPRVSADLIFGFPGESEAEWLLDLDKILSFNPRHVSCYALTAEEGTPFARDVKEGLVGETLSDTMALLQEATYRRFEAAGLPAYEISNFAIPGYESRHNLAYWDYRPYLGLGAGAWSGFAADPPWRGRETAVFRHMNHKAPEHYMRKVEEGAGFFTEETVDPTTAAKEFLMMGLRLRSGVAESDFLSRFGVALDSLCPRSSERHLTQGGLLRRAGRIVPSWQGWLRNNALLADFFAELDGARL